MSGMKSAYELAMERLGGESRALSEVQKRALAEIDARLTAKIAETEIMFNQQCEAEPDPAKASLIQQTRQQQIARLREEAKEEKERIRQEA